MLLTAFIIFIYISHDDGILPYHVNSVLTRIIILQSHLEHRVIVLVYFPALFSVILEVNISRPPFDFQRFACASGPCGYSFTSIPSSSLRYTSRPSLPAASLFSACSSLIAIYTRCFLLNSAHALSLQHFLLRYYQFFPDLLYYGNILNGSSALLICSSICFCSPSEVANTLTE